MSTNFPPGTVQAMLEVAQRNVGFVEGPNNWNPYAPLVGHAQNQPWCASFLAACAKRAAVRLRSESPYTPAMANGFKAQGRWHTIGQVGDFVFFHWPSMGRIAHVGVVESLRQDGCYITIEGNTDSVGGRTGGRVMRQVRRAHIAGFGRPVYVTPPVTNVPEGRSPHLSYRLPNYYGPKVADIQRGFIKIYPGNRAKIGSEYEQERYGPQTSAVVEVFKQNRGITEEGFGPICWERLRADIAKVS